MPHCLKPTTVNYLRLDAAAGHPAPLHTLLVRSSSLAHLQQIQAQLTSHPIFSISPPLHSLIRSASVAGHLNYAARLLEHFRPASPIPWNYLIQAYSKSPTSRESLRLFRLMLSAVFISPDKYTYTFLLTSCSREPSPVPGCAVHAMTVKTGFVFDLFVANSLVNLYSEFGKLRSAQSLFDEMLLRDSVSWTNLLKGYVKRGNLEAAHQLFTEMPQLNDISRVVIVAGYLRAGKHHDAVKLAICMLRSSDGPPPCEAVVVSALSACTHIGALSQGSWIHGYVDKTELPMTINITNALIDMYCKCGILDSAMEVFAGARERDLLTWSSMISGLALHGRGAETLHLFRRMVANGIRPDNIAVLGVLNGCSHAGLVVEGCSIFYSMNQSWGIVPEIEHYGSLVDLLGRAGELREALGIVIKMPIEPDIVIWRSLLSSCRNHQKLELGERILGQIHRLDLSKQGGGHVLISNLCATAGSWEKAAKLRSVITGERDGQNPGWSCIEVDGEVHQFVAEDRLHP